MFGQNAIHANFSVNDLAAAQEFYCEKLGFKLIKSYEGQMMLEAGSGTKIMVYEKPDHHPWDSTVLGIEVSDVASAVQQLQERGITTAKLPGTNEQGIIEDPEMGSAAWFQDPAENWVCVSDIKA